MSFVSRYTTTDAIVLRVARFGEYHKRLSLLTVELGIIDAVAYGAFKSRSKLSGVSDPFGRISAHLYYEPVKKNYKLTDAEPISFFPEIRNDVKRYYAASLLCEVVLKTYAGGDEHRRLHATLLDSFALLEHANDSECDYLLTQSLFRFLTVIGYPPELAHCSMCGKQIGRADHLYVSHGGVVTCGSCKSPESSLLSAGARAYLVHTEHMKLNEALTVSLDERSRKGVKTSIIRIVQGIIETPLSTVRSAGGLL